MAEICFFGDGEPSAGHSKSRPRNSSSRRRMDFFQVNSGADDANSSSPSQNARKRRSVHPHQEPRGWEDAEENRELQRKNVEIEIDDGERINYGVTSVCGRRREMEDAVSVHPCFANLKNRPHFPLHFFGVFDGHGCSHVSLSCENRMHVIVKEEIESELGESEEWNKLMKRSFGRMDDEMNEYRHDNNIKRKETFNITCRCELLTSHQYDTVGSTALVALVAPNKFIVSNCGDSRAVLCRKSGVVPLSSDHKPDRPDELSRIESTGGCVIYWDGARVLGVLATSRAIGDGYLKPYVISEPEVVVMDRTAEDEFIILASDGLWDVVSNETACEAVRTCMRVQRATSSSSSSDSSCRTCTDASIVLTKLAMAKQSSDNISVVVIDLRRHHEHK